MLRTFQMPLASTMKKTFNIIYEHSVDKQELKAIITIFGVKYHLYCLAICNVCYKR